MSQSSREALRLAVPSDGEMYEPTTAFLVECSLALERRNARQYMASIPSLDGILALFQRAADITGKVEEGSADIGIVGLDRFEEGHVEAGDGIVITPDLGYSRCELVIAVPESWVDVTHMADIADLAVEFRERGRDLRVAAKYPRLVQRFLFSHGVNYFTIVHSSGTLEVAPAMGFADIIADIASTGMTLRENHLKTLGDGTVLSSQACLIGNRKLLSGDPGKLEIARRFIERVEGYLEARGFFQITANIPGASADQVAATVQERPDLAGLQGPTVSQVYSGEGEDWYAVTVVVPRQGHQEALDYFRSIGGTGISVVQPRYIYNGESQTYQRLLQAL